MPNARKKFAIGLEQRILFSGCQTQEKSLESVQSKESCFQDAKRKKKVCNRSRAKNLVFRMPNARKRFGIGSEQRILFSGCQTQEKGLESVQSKESCFQDAKRKKKVWNRFRAKNLVFRMPNARKRFGIGLEQRILFSGCQTQEKGLESVQSKESCFHDAKRKKKVWNRFRAKNLVFTMPNARKRFGIGSEQRILFSRCQTQEKGLESVQSKESCFQDAKRKKKVCNWFRAKNLVFTMPNARKRFGIGLEQRILFSRCKTQEKGLESVQSKESCFQDAKRKKKVWNRFRAKNLVSRMPNARKRFGIGLEQRILFSGCQTQEKGLESVQSKESCFQDAKRKKKVWNRFRAKNLVFRMPNARKKVWNWFRAKNLVFRMPNARKKVW